jgi:hypothetical protein
MQVTTLLVEKKKTSLPRKLLLNNKPLMMPLTKRPTKIPMFQQPVLNAQWTVWLLCPRPLLKTSSSSFP